MERSARALGLVSIVLCGCGGAAPRCPDTAAVVGNQQGAGSSSSGPAIAGPSPPPAASAPAGFMLASVQAVIPTADGNALLLREPAPRGRVVPVMIGEAEAFVIDLRLRGEAFERPLTHDLLDTLVRALGGTVVMVQVDKLRSGVFVASVFVWDGRAMHRVDARTSDAVAVALGARAPIYVSSAVFDEAGLAP